jgi:hypothetical protein
MDLVADIDAALPFLRQQAESMMTDTCTVKRATGETEPDPVTYEEVPTYTVIHTGLKCKVKAGATQANAVQIPGQTIVLSGMELHVPISTVGVLTNDLVTIDTVDPVMGDPDMVGKVLRVTGPFLKSRATARRFRVEVAS